MKKALIILSVVFFLNKVNSQNPIENCTSAVTVSSTVSNFRIFNYPEKTYVGMVYKSLNEVKNLYPEELLSSILCANSQSWVDFNEITPPIISQEKIRQINEVDRKKTFFELVQKIEFEANGTTYALIKFRLYQDKTEKVLNLTETMVLKNKRWYRINEPFLTPLIFMIGMTKVEYLNYLFEGKKSGSAVFDKIISNSKENRINLNNYLKETAIFAEKEGFDKLQFLFEVDIERLNTQPVFAKDFTNFKTISTEIEYSVPIKEFEFCEFFDDETNKNNDSTFFGKTILQKELIEKREDSTIKYIHKISFEFNFEKYHFVKYILNHNNSKSEKIICFLNKKDVNVTEEIGYIKNVFFKLNPKTFWAFYNENESGNPKIDKIKKELKTAENWLKLDKLNSLIIKDENIIK